jgi:hypothetical protein
MDQHICCFFMSIEGTVTPSCHDYYSNKNDDAQPIVPNLLSINMILIPRRQHKERCKMSAGHTEIITIVMLDRILWSTISTYVFLLYPSSPAYLQNTVSSTILFYHPLLSLSSLSHFFLCLCLSFVARSLVLLSASHRIPFWLITPN